MDSILIAVLLLAGHAAESDGHAPAVWSVDDRVLSCSPNPLRASDNLVLGLGPGHGQELAIHRVSDNAWYFLVVQHAPADTPQLMPPEDFATAARVEIPTSFKSRAWEAEAGLEPIFNGPGVYEAYVSEILESEIGGYSCRFDYIGMRAGSSSTTTPLPHAA